MRLLNTDGFQSSGSVKTWSVRERPASQLFLSETPEPGQSMRFHDQEDQDQHSENDKLHMFGADRSHAEAVNHGLFQRNRHQDHEERAEEGSEDRAQAADDDHEQNKE